jgi:KipI family sensor histidine kinase inhibitor
VSEAAIRDAGDSAFVLELDAVIDPAVNARAIGIAAAIAARRLAGVRDVIPTYRSVAVHFDPLGTDLVALKTSMREAIDSAPATTEGALVEVPVSYGGEDGPDLGDVAARAGLSPQEVIERFCATEYRVFMLGFLPGFAYMGSVDEAIAAPRKATPRTKVPPGSVGIAGRQTGVYPRQSPGGWQLIGRTSLAVFDPSRIPASIFAPGDRVRFVPVTALNGDQGSGIRDQAVAVTYETGSLIPDPRSHSVHRSITIIRPGLFTTIQDIGRWGHQDRGVPVAGPMDAISHRLVNALVGNARDAATLEATLTGPELRFDQPTVVAVAGADLGASIDAAPLPLNTPRRCEAGAVLRFGERRAGTRAYIACDGGIAVPPVLGSRATHVVSGLGGTDGRSLIAGDCLPLGEARTEHVHGAPGEMKRGSAASPGGARLRVMRGPQDDWFDQAAFDTLQRARFTISSQSDRMGYRLTGTAVTRPSGQMISDATFTGGLQVPPSGDPILLMADRQTTGGYPQIAIVITADLPLAGQLAPGDWVEFELCTREQAIAALIDQEGSMRAIG